ncbi:MAG TPA: hypothetical protein VKP03_02620 [Patescibacteria group bacterium]|nr:hypothetical protein [Patescibacteria group bacterium]
MLYSEPLVKDYILTGDLRVLVSRTINNGKGFFYLPDKKIFDRLTGKLRKKLERILSPHGIALSYFPWEYVKTGILRHLSKASQDVPVISLDKVYVEQGTADIFFDTGRIVHFSEIMEQNNPFFAWSEIGRGPRETELSIKRQLDRIVNQGRIKAMRKKRVIVVDDGTWTRKSLLAVKSLLGSAGIEVEKFIIGIEIRDETKDCQTLDVPFEWVERFSRQRVHDWVAERDFFVGVDYSGRIVGEQLFDHSHEEIGKWYFGVPMEGNYCAPYIMPLGNPVAWAGIPISKVKEFSVFCLNLSIELCLAIEKETKAITCEKRILKVGHLPRIPFHYRKKRDWSVVKAIEESINRLEKGGSGR